MANQPNRRPTDCVCMVSPYFEGAESIPGLGLPRFLGFGSGSGATTSRRTQIWVKIQPGRAPARPKSRTFFRPASQNFRTFGPLGLNPSSSDSRLQGFPNLYNIPPPPSPTQKAPRSSEVQCPLRGCIGRHADAVRIVGRMEKAKFFCGRVPPDPEFGRC